MIGSTSAEADNPAAGQFTTPCAAGMNASDRSHGSRTEDMYGVA
jgi:hypothetical protein